MPSLVSPYEFIELYSSLLLPRAGPRNKTYALNVRVGSRLCENSRRSPPHSEFARFIFSADRVDAVEADTATLGRQKNRALTFSHSLGRKPPVAEVRCTTINLSVGVAKRVPRRGSGSCAIYETKNAPNFLRKIFCKQDLAWSTPPRFESAPPLRIRFPLAESMLRFFARSEKALRALSLLFDPISDLHRSDAWNSFNRKCWAERSLQLLKGGWTDLSNAQILCSPCNLHKAAH